MSVLALLALASTVIAVPVTPAPVIKNVVTFGDSLSDNGNLFAQYKFPPAPYFKGRFSNGPTWVEQLSGFLGNASLYDYAYGGACANVTNAVGSNLTGTPIVASTIPDIFAQYALYQKDSATKGLKLEETLFTVFAGGNDVNYVFDRKGTPDVISIAGSVVQLVSLIAKSGGKQILVTNLPPLHLSPRMRPFAALAENIKKLVDGYNLVLSRGLAQVRTAFPGTTITINDMNGLLTYISTEEGGKFFGFTNTTDACLKSGSICAEVEKTFFWDGLHPSTRGQGFVAQYAYNQVFGFDGYLKPVVTTATTTTVAATSVATSAATSAIPAYSAPPAATGVLYSGSEKLKAGLIAVAFGFMFLI